MRAAELDVLRQARAALPGRRLIGLIDPDLPPLPAPARACLDAVCANAYAAQQTTPECFVRLRDDDPLPVARLLLDPAIPSVMLDLCPTGAVARYWRSRTQSVVPADALWGEAASLRRGRSSAPRLAVLSPAPDLPLCHALRRRGADVFGPEELALLSPHYDRALFLLTNQPESRPLIRLLRRHGGSAIVLDSCLLDAYEPARAIRLAADELGRMVPHTEFRLWQKGIVRPEALLLADVIAAADPVFVHSQWLVDEIARRYGRTAVLVPPPTLRRVRAEATGLQAESCVWAVEMLHEWGRDVRLDLACWPEERVTLAALAARLGIGELVGFAPGSASVALFLAMRGQGSLPASLATSGGERRIASRAIVEAVDLGDVTVVADEPSPPLLAEAILAALPDAVDAEPIAAALGI